MTRISSSGATDHILKNLFRNQKLMTKESLKVSSGYNSDSYKGLNEGVRRLLDYDQKFAQTTQQIANGKHASTQMKLVSQVLESVEETMQIFSRRLMQLSDRNTYDQNRVYAIQKLAYDSMVSIQDYLNTEMAGVYLFSGDKVGTKPVDLGLTSFDDFQKKYDGDIQIYATTRESHLSDLSHSKVSTNMERINVDENKWLQFHGNENGNDYTAGRSYVESTGDTFKNYKAGSRIEIEGTALNNGFYIIDEVSADGRRVYIRTESLTNERAQQTLPHDNDVTGVTLRLDKDVEITDTHTGPLSFNTLNGTITSARTGAFSKIKAGASIHIDGIGDKNGTYTVKSVSEDNKTITIDKLSVISFLDDKEIPQGNKGNITFDKDTDTITSALAGAFDTVKSGDYIKIKNTLHNNGSYKVLSVSKDGSRLQIESSRFKQEGTQDDDIINTYYHFDSASNSITVKDHKGKNIDGFFAKVDPGEAITIGGSASNSGDYTVAGVSADGSKLILSNNTPLFGVNEVVSTDIKVFQKSSLLVNEKASQGIQPTGERAVDRSYSFNSIHNTVAVRDKNHNLLENAFAGLKAGDYITFDGSSIHTGEYRIKSISDDYSTLSLESGTPLYGKPEVLEKAVSVSIIDSFITPETVRYNVTDSPKDDKGNPSLEQNVVFKDVHGNTVDNSLTHGVIFDAATRKVVAKNAGAFDALRSLDVVTITDSHGNNGTFRIGEITANGTSMELVPSTVFFNNQQHPAGGGNTGDIVFNNKDGTITIESQGTLFGYKAGDTIRVTGTAHNNGTYVIKDVSADGTRVTLSSKEVIHKPPFKEVENDTTATLTLADGTVLDRNNFGSVSFNSAQNKITAEIGGAFRAVKAGDLIRLSDAQTSNGTLKVIGVDPNGSHLIVQSAATISRDDGRKLSPADIGGYDFDATTGTLIAAQERAFAGFSAGDQITIKDTTENNGNYIIKSISDDAKTMVLSEKIIHEAKGYDNNGSQTADSFFDYTLGSQMVFDANTHSLSIRNFDNENIAERFRPLIKGDTLTIAGTQSNNGTFTVASISDDGSTIYFDPERSPAIVSARDTNGASVTSSARAINEVTGSSIAFNADSGRITLNNAADGVQVGDVFGALAAGHKIKITGSGINDGTYTIEAVSEDGKSFSVKEALKRTQTLTPDTSDTAIRIQSFATAGTVSTRQSYYHGGSRGYSRRIDDNTSISFSHTASSGAFEKALRAMATIAQGKFGTAGGLENNLERVKFASNLILSARNNDTVRSSDIDENTENMDSLIEDTGYNLRKTAQVQERLEEYENILQEFIDDIEQADQSKAVVSLLKQQQTINASYKVINQFLKLNLAEYI